MFLPRRAILLSAISDLLEVAIVLMVLAVSVQMLQ